MWVQAYSLLVSVECHEIVQRKYGTRLSKRAFPFKAENKHYEIPTTEVARFLAILCHKRLVEVTVTFVSGELRTAI